MHFKELYTGGERWTQYIPHLVSEVENRQIGKEISKEEAVETIWGFKSNKAPG